MTTPDTERLDRFEITIDPRAVLYIQGYGPKHEPRPSISELVERAAKEAGKLIKPLAICSEFPLAELADDSVTLTNGVRFSIGKTISGWWKGSRSVVIAICTIGPDLERRCSEMSAAGDHVAALNLDIAGSVALGDLGDQVHQHICSQAATRGIEMGPFLNPGYREWPLTDQRFIFDIMPAGEIGVTLNEHCMMIPRKSVTFCSGAGVAEAHEHFNRCRHCSLAKCPYRRLSRTDNGGVQGLHGGI